MTLRMQLSRLASSQAVCVVLAGCAGSEGDTDSATAAVAAGRASLTDETEADPAAEEVAAAARLASPRGARVCGTGVDCGAPGAPLHGSVRAPQTRFGATATYACASGYALAGDATRRCQRNGVWSGSTPTCSFTATGAPCGACGGVYDATGTCSVPTPAGFGAPCDVGSGLGACAGGGAVGCDGACHPTDPALGAPAVWHITPAPNGSWDWDCDGVVTPAWQLAGTPPADCAGYSDADACQGAAAVDYLAEATPCGEQAIVQTRDCQWMSFGPACINTPDPRRVVYQECR